MDFPEMLGDAYAYTMNGVIQNTSRWLRLILAVVCLGLPFNGYLLRIYRGEKPAPEVDGWGGLFIDGLKLLAIGLVYILPFIIIILLIFLAIILAVGIGRTPEAGLAAGIFGNLLMILMYLAEIIVGIFLPVAYIRFARTGIFGEAFNFSALAETIGRIGWINYVIAVILVGLVIGIPICILIFAFVFLFLIAALLFKSLSIVILLLAVMVAIVLIVLPPVGVFHARYLTRLYDSGDVPAFPNPVPGAGAPHEP